MTGITSYQEGQHLYTHYDKYSSCWHVQTATTDYGRPPAAVPVSAITYNRTPATYAVAIVRCRNLVIIYWCLPALICYRYGAACSSTPIVCNLLFRAPSLRHHCAADCRRSRDPTCVLQPVSWTTSSTSSTRRSSCYASPWRRWILSKHPMPLNT